MLKYLTLASHLTCRGDLRRTYRLAAVAIRTDGAMVHSCNLATIGPEPVAHAEARVARKVDAGSVVYVARTLRDGQIAMAKPCKFCQLAMKHRGVVKCFYTIGPNEYGCIEF